MSSASGWPGSGSLSRRASERWRVEADGEVVVMPDAAFDALADPVRREILAVLAEHDECSAGEVAAAIERVGRTAVSSHLRVLCRAGLITEERRGRYRYYAVDPDGAAKDVIRSLQQLLQSSLAAAAAAAEARRPTPADDGDVSTTSSVDRPAM